MHCSGPFASIILANDRPRDRRRHWSLIPPRPSHGPHRRQTAVNHRRRAFFCPSRRISMYGHEMIAAVADLASPSAFLAANSSNGSRMLQRPTPLTFPSGTAAIAPARRRPQTLPHIFGKGIPIATARLAPARFRLGLFLLDQGKTTSFRDVILKTLAMFLAVWPCAVFFFPCS
jgi:hypothetical protein